MRAYADTSVLFSAYASDANTARAQALIPTLTVRLVFTALHRLELRNALALAIFRGKATPREVARVWHDVHTDLAARVLCPVPVKW